MTNPWVRLAARALVAGVTSALVLYQANAAAWPAALIAGVLAASEVLTPINSTVGIGKDEKPAAGYMK
jgi:predicted small secreted protein